MTKTPQPTIPKSSLTDEQLSNKYFKVLNGNGTLAEAWRAIADAAVAADLAQQESLAQKFLEALESIVEVHNMYCEHHKNVSFHSHDLANIAEEALHNIAAQQKGDE